MKRRVLVLTLSLVAIGALVLQARRDDYTRAFTSALAVPLTQFVEGVRTTSDENFTYIESSGMPQHNMMVGIRSWQQQVPLPQPYSGDNAWKILRHPVLSDHPISARTGLYRGAIAIATNGVPIFNALNNRGEDAFLAGELDKWGGHCGRADDYHYHTAPIFLQKQADKPIAFALDGFPIFGLTEPAGSPVRKLNEFNGHLDNKGSYHYHATKTYPYINGGLRGVVEVRDGQVDPQPRSVPVRPALPPLRGATITGFKSVGPRAYSLQYTLDNRSYQVNYRFDAQGHYNFDFVDEAGARRTENYTRNAPPGDKSQDNLRAAPSDSGDPNRQPWIAVHAAELDLNGDGTLTRREFLTEVNKVFRGYDVNADGQIAGDETAADVHSAMAGYITRHAPEIDRNNDGIITRDELQTESRRTFNQTDADSDGEITPQEFASPTKRR